MEVEVGTGWVVLRPGMMAYGLSSRVGGASQEQGGRSKKIIHPNSFFLTWHLFSRGLKIYLDLNIGQLKDL